MKLADLRRLAILTQSAIRFPIRNGMECIVSEHGVARVPALAGVPDFKLEEELERAQEFVLAGGGEKGSERRLSRQELEDLAAGIHAPAPQREQD